MASVATHSSGSFLRKQGFMKRLNEHLMGESLHGCHAYRALLMTRETQVNEVHAG